MNSCQLSKNTSLWKARTSLSLRDPKNNTGLRVGHRSLVKAWALITELSATPWIKITKISRVDRDPTGGNISRITLKTRLKIGGSKLNHIKLTSNKTILWNLLRKCSGRSKRILIKRTRMKLDPCQRDLGWNKLKEKI